MKTFCRLVALTLWVGVLALPAVAQDWGQIATVSSTLGINGGRVCVGEGTRSDIGCPTYAPSVSSGGLLTATALSATTVNGHYASFTTITTGTYYGDGSNLSGVTASAMDWYGLTNIPTGVQNISTTELAVTELTQLQHIDTSVLPASVWTNLAYLNQSVSTTSTPTFDGLTASNIVTATYFEGDGSRLTSVTAASSDRITSGTTNVIANGNTGYVSFTSSGVTTGYYSPEGVFAAVGISTSSNQASFTTVYASGNIGIGTTAPSATTHVSGTLMVAGGTGSETCSADYAGLMRRNPTTGRLQTCR